MEELCSERLELGKRSFQYRRGIEDVSTVSVVYSTLNSTPLVVPTGALEHPSVTTSFVTPNELSETFVYHADPMAYAAWALGANNGQQAAAQIALGKISMGGVGSEAEAVQVFWDSYRGEQDRDILEKEALGRVKWGFQELLNIVYTDSSLRTLLPQGWPTA